MWLSDLRIVLPDRVLARGAVQIQDGVITEIVEGSAPGDMPSLEGLTLLPGLIDIHGDMLERDIEPRPSARFPTEMGLIEIDKRYASSGITTAFAAVSFAWRRNDIRSQESAIEIIETINRLSDELLVDLCVHARFEVTNPATGSILRDLLDRKLVHLVSIMDHTPGQGQYKNIDSYLNFMQRWLGPNLDALGEHKDGVLAAMKQNIEAAVQIPRDWNVVEDVVRVALAHKVPVASHDDDTSEKVAQQAQMGVTISEFPVTKEAARAAHQHGMKTVMGAPNAYRGESTSQNLSAMDAIHEGLVDILATDYYPASILHAIFKLAREGVMPLYESVKLASTNAADVMRMNDRGRIAVGYRADLVLVHENGRFPRVRGTLRKGVPIYWDSRVACLFQGHKLFASKGESITKN